MAVEISYQDIEFMQVGADLSHQDKQKDVLTGAIIGGVIGGETGAVIGVLDALKPETVTVVSGDRLTLTVRDKDLGIREIAIATPTYHPLSEEAIKALEGEHEAIVTIITGFSPVLNTLVARIQEWKKRAEGRDQAHLEQPRPPSFLKLQQIAPYHFRLLFLLVSNESRRP